MQQNQINRSSDIDLTCAFFSWASIMPAPFQVLGHCLLDHRSYARGIEHVVLKKEEEEWRMVLPGNCRAENGSFSLAQVVLLRLICYSMHLQYC